MITGKWWTRSNSRSSTITEYTDIISDTKQGVLDGLKDLRHRQPGIIAEDEPRKVDVDYWSVTVYSQRAVGLSGVK